MKRFIRRITPSLVSTLFAFGFMALSTLLLGRLELDEFLSTVSGMSIGLIGVMMFYSCYDFLSGLLRG